MGILIGLLMADHVQAAVGMAARLARAAEPPRRVWGTRGRAPLWAGAVQDELGRTTDPNRQMVLRKLLEDGDEALGFLATSTGVTKRTALARILDEHVVRENATGWGL